MKRKKQNKGLSQINLDILTNIFSDQINATMDAIMILSKSINYKR